MRSHFRYLILFLLCFTAWGQEAWGDQSYFQALVPIRAQSASERQAAARKGLQEVLVRMSGSEEILVNAQIRKAIRKAQTYIEQFQYRTIDDELLKQEGYQQALLMFFSPKLIKRILLNEARVPFWPPNRPRVLVWLVEDDPVYGRQMINKGMASPIIEAIEDAALERGLPLAWPLLDFEDQSSINANLLWRLDEASIVHASMRYRAEVILAGRISTTSQGDTLTSWQLLHQDYTESWDLRSKEVNKLSWEVLGPVTHYLANLTSVVPSDEGAIVLNLQGVSNFKHYREALDYFNGLALVSEVRLIEVRPNAMLLALISETTLERFATTVALHKKILSVPPQPTAFSSWQQMPLGTYNNPVEYNWLGQ